MNYNLSSCFLKLCLPAFTLAVSYTTQLTSLKEENLRLTEVRRRQLHEIETLKDQLRGLVVEVDSVKAEETRLKKLLSDTGEEVCKAGNNLKHKFCVQQF